MSLFNTTSSLTFDEDKFFAQCEIRITIIELSSAELKDIHNSNTKIILYFQGE